MLNQVARGAAQPDVDRTQTDRAWSKNVVDMLIVSQGTFLDDADHRAAVSYALAFVARDAAQYFTHAYDKLRNAADAGIKPGGIYRDAVHNFLETTENRRVRHLTRAIQSRNITHLRHAHKMASKITQSPLDPRNREPALRQLERIDSLRRQLGDKSLPPPTPSKTVPHTPSIKAALQLIGVPQRSLVVKGGTRRVSHYFREGIKEKYVANIPDMPVDVSPTMFSRLHAIEGIMGAYTLGRTFTHGSFGKVRLAIDTDGIAWVVKEFRLEPKHKADTQSSEEASVRDEVELGDLVDSGVKVRETFAVEEKIYTVLPLMDCDLVDFSQAPLENNTYTALMRLVFREVAGDLKRCHDQNVMHRDIKPDNILLHRDGRIVLADLGLAARRLEVDAFDIKGTPGYFAPEVLLGRPFFDTYNDRADIFSLGLMMAYTHANAEQCPFWFDSNKSEDIHEHMRSAYDYFEAWRAVRSMDTNTKKIDWHKVEVNGMAGLIPMDKFAADFYRRDPDLAAYVFDHMLQLEPDDRDDAAQVAAAATAMYNPEAAYEATLSQALHDAVKSVSKNDENIAELSAHHEQFQFEQAVQTPLPPRSLDENAALTSPLLAPQPMPTPVAAHTVSSGAFVNTPPHSKPASTRSPSPPRAGDEQTPPASPADGPNASGLDEGFEAIGLGE